jgi:hypothetical protein
MTTPRMDDPFDRRLRAFLDWQAEQLAGAPTANEITARLAGQAQGPLDGRFGGRLGRGPAAQLAWAFLILALVAAMAVAVAVIGSQDHRTSVILPTGSPSASPTPTPTPEGSSTPAACPLPTEVVPAGSTPASPAVPQGPADALVAYLANEDTELRITGGGASGARVAARIVPANTTDVSEVLGWSDDGSTLLVHLHLFSGPGGPERNCGDLWLVKADGSGATKLTANGQGADPSAAVLAGSGRFVAYVQSGDLAGSAIELRLVDATGVTTVLSPKPCAGAQDLLWPFGTGRLAWSQDGARLALLCHDSVHIYSVADQTTRDFFLPSGTLAVSMAWSSDGTRLMVASVPTGSGSNQGPLTILTIDPRVGLVTVVSESSVNVEWIIGGVDAFSPDGSAFIASGGTPGAVPGGDFTSTWYMIDVATGVARQLFDRDEPCDCAEWLPDSSGVVYLDPRTSNALAQVGLDGKPVATLGSLERWGAWHWLNP